MSNLYIQFLGALGFVVLLSLVRELHRKRSFKSWAKQMGCGEAPVLPGILPGGLERYVLKFHPAIEKIDFGEKVARAPFDKLNACTFRMNKFGSPSTYYTIEPENAKAVLSTQFDDFEFGPLRSKNLEDCFGHGIITAEGADWSRFRRQLKPHFSREHVSNLEDAEHHLEIMVKSLPSVDEFGWTAEVDMVPVYLRFTMDTATDFLFGESCNSQTAAMSGDGGHDDTDFAAAMDYAWYFIGLRARMDFLYWVLPTGKFLKASKTIHDFVDRYVTSALHGKGSGMRNRKTVLLEDLAESTQNPKELRDQVLQLLAAGRNTTGNLLSFTTMLLSRHPEEYAKLRAEVLTAFPPGTKPTFESLNACKSITHVLYETLRLLPLTLLTLPRRAKKDTTLPRGGGSDGKQPLAVREGEGIGFSQYAMYRRKDIWGPDADEFRPSRWEDRKLGVEFLPFSMGPRTCLGQQMALTESAFVIARMLQTFDRMEHVEAHLPLETRVSTLTKLRDGVKVRMHKA